VDAIEPVSRPVPRIARVEAAAPVVPAAERSEARLRNVRSAGSAAVADNALQMKQSNPRQEAENEYRRALALVQDGRVTAGISALEQTLRLSPRHDAARQTLIGLLLESRRSDEAMQQLEQGLALDPAQTAMAMTLARLQVERGGPALQTLQRSLSNAQDNPDYQSFIAALLQREQRHKEAVEHYTSALRMNPKNGIWWMGLGISLQADQRLPEARMAFQKAKASGTLDGELPNFVDKKLQQLGR
jgi:MSHA biogenesis protein MshN